MIQELYSVSGDNRINGLLFSPDEIRTRLPVVIMCHGLYANHSWFDYYAENLVQEDVLCYLFDFPGAKDSISEGNFVDSSILTEVTVLDSVIRMISELDCVDNQQIYLLGHSQGGLVSAISAIKNNIKGLFLLSPSFNVPSEMAQVTLPSDGQLIRILPGLVSRKYIEDARSIDVDDVISKYTNSVTIFHGSLDNAVCLDYSITASEKYIDSELIVLDGEKHNLSSNGQRQVLNNVIRKINGDG